MEVDKFAALVTAFRLAVRETKGIPAKRLCELVGNRPRTPAESDFLDAVAECRGIGKVVMVAIIEEERGGLGR